MLYFAYGSNMNWAQMKAACVRRVNDQASVCRVDMKKLVLGGL
jgi:hypothetical protein